MGLREALALAGVAVAACGGGVSVFGEPAPTGGTGGAGSGASSALASHTVGSASSSAQSGGSEAASGSMESSSAAGSPPSCGNGDIDDGETCDDENAADGDGCSSNCLIEGDPGQCSGGAILTLAERIVLSDSTKNHANFTTASCGGAPAPDVVYQVVPTKTAPIAIRLDAEYKHVFAVRKSCGHDGGQAELICDHKKNPLEFTVDDATMGQPFYLLVSGFNSASGAFTLELEY